MRRRHVVLSAIVVAVTGTAVALTVPAIAGTNSPPGDAGTFSDAAAGVDPDVVMAMQRDLSLSVDQVGVRLRKERIAGETETKLRSQIGARFGGAWLAEGANTLVVGVTDESAAAKVRAAGAQPKIVSTPESELNDIKRGLDDKAAHASKSVTGWYVDVTTSSVVVVAKPGGEAAAKALIAASGATSGKAAQAVRVVTSKEAPRPLYDVRGADAYYINNSARCSIGFAVQGGFVTAGHCGTSGSTTAGSNRVSQGTFKSSSFPGNDYAFVSTNSNWAPTGVVNDYNGGTVAVYGSQESAVGAAICRSGSTTGTHCGVVQAKNATVNYAEGSVSGLTRTNVCAEPGDSGGSWMSGNQAQGVTSGGSGDCTSGGTTFFQPVNEILSALSLTLVTAGQGGTNPTPSATPSSPNPTRSSAKPPVTPSSPNPTRTTPPVTPSSPNPTRTTPPVTPSSPNPTPSATVPPSATAPPSEPQPTGSATPPTPPAQCTGLEASADGELSGTGARKTIPSAGYFRAGSGQHVACLTGPTTANFDVSLQRWSGRRWVTVAKAATAGIGQDEVLTYSGSAGYYRYRLVSAEGSGPYLLTANIP